MTPAHGMDARVRRLAMGCWPLPLLLLPVALLGVVMAALRAC